MNARAPVLVVLAGRPGSGKTTVGKALALATGAVFLRVDTVETVLGPACGAQGYAVIQALAAENLALGRDVIADSVNPVAASRDAFAAVARAAGARLLDVEIVCSNLAEHRRRVEARLADIPGHRVPQWAEVQASATEPWDRPRVILDTGRRSVGEAVALLMGQMGGEATDAW